MLLALCQLILSKMHFSHGGAKSGVDLETKATGDEGGNRWWAGLCRQPGEGGSGGSHVRAAPFHSVTVGFMRRPRLMDGTSLHTYRTPEWACHPQPGCLRDLCSCSCGGQSLRRTRCPQHLLTVPVNKIPRREDQNQTALKLR